MSASSTSGGGGLDAKTLAITAAASATAAYVMSELWAPGTLASAAVTPVLIALLKEGLAKPADVVTRAVPVRGVVRSAGQPHEPHASGSPAAEPYHEPVVEHGARVPQPGEIPGRSRPATGRAWRMAVVTGLLGFVIAAVIITVPEFIAGGSAAGGDRQTTFFGGTKDSSDESSPTNTTTEPTETDSDQGAPGSTVTVPPVQTTTVPPAQTTTVAPAQTTTVPPSDDEEPPPPPAP